MFSAYWIGRKNKNIQPSGPEKEHSYIKKESVFIYTIIENGSIIIYNGNK